MSEERGLSGIRLFQRIAAASSSCVCAFSSSSFAVEACIYVLFCARGRHLVDAVTSSTIAPTPTTTPERIADRSGFNHVLLSRSSIQHCQILVDLTL